MNPLAVFQFSTRSFMSMNKRVKSNQFMQTPKRDFRPSNALNNKDYYKTLDIDRSSSQTDIKKAYFQKAKQYHPDVNKSKGAKEKFEEINEAYETLGDESKKRMYDTTGMTGDQ